MITKSTKHIMKWALGIVFASTTLSQIAEAQSVTIDPAGPIVCAGTTLNAITTGMTGPFTYRWSNGATTPSIVVTQTAAYRVRVRGFINGSRRNVFSPWTAFFVVQNPVAVITPPGPVNVCPGESVSLFGGGGQYYSYYSWNSGATTKDVTVNQTGDYELTVYNDFPGCYTASTATVHVEVFDAGYQPTITALSPTTVCKNAYVQLSGDPGFSGYQWSTGATTQNVSVLMDGSGGGAVLDTQTVTLTVGLNNNQCTFTSSGVVLRSVRQIGLINSHCGNFSLTPNDSIKSQVVLTYINAPEYEFEFEETSNPNATWTYLSSTRWCNLANVNPPIEANKFYNVRVRPVIGGTPYCYGNTCQIGIVPPIAQNDGIRVSSAGSGVIVSNVFPNPSSASFRLVLQGIEEDQNVSVRVSDLSGRLVDQFAYDTYAGSIEFGENLNSGVYIVTSQQGENISVSRIVKTN